MDHLLWNKILEFDLDGPFSEYGFSTRLADENYWTKNFTKKAILEYKKFMYLAGSSDFMVSPSEIIDTVWHQHLIYTQSYTDFCQVMGKNIQHIPSTHNKEDVERFRQAKERTKRLYSETFGEQPKDIWDYSGMYESLELPKSKWKLRSFVLVAILAFVVLSIPFYFLLKPLYIQIDNPYFIQGFILLAVMVFAALEIFNRKYLMKTVRDFDSSSFLHDLTAQELIFLKTQSIANVVHGTMNQLVEEGKIIVIPDHRIEKSNFAQPASLEEYQVFEICDLFGRTYYLNVLRTLMQKPVFQNVSNCMKAFKKFFNKSKRFGRLFYLNLAVLGLVLMFAFIRLVTGVLRDRPIEYLILTVIIFCVLSAVFLIRLGNITFTTIVPQFYKNQVVPLKQTEDDLQWQYFLFGSTVLAASFIPTVQYTQKQNTSVDGGAGAPGGGGCGGGGGGSSCGSSCSSCGGCGGGD